MSRRELVVLVVCSLGVSAYALVSQGAPWLGQWNWTVDAATGCTVLTAPLTSSFAGWRRFQLRTLTPLISSTPRAWASDLRVWSTVTIAAVLSFGFAACCALVATAASVHGGPVDWQPLLVAPLVLCAAAAFGVVTTSLRTSYLTVVACAPVWFAASTFGPHWFRSMLRQGTATASLAGLTFNSTTLLLQAIGLVGLTSLTLAVGLPRRDRAFRRARLALLTGAPVLLIAASASLISTGSPRFVASSERPTACLGSTAVCLAPSDKRDLRRTAASMLQAEQPLRRIGITDFPTSYQQLLPGYVPPVSAGMIQSPIDRAVGRTSDRLRAAAALVATPAACKQWTNPHQAPAEKVFEAQQLMIEWIVMRNGGPSQPWSKPSRDWLATATSASAQTWLRNTFRQLRTCDFSAMSLPFPTTDQ